MNRTLQYLNFNVTAFLAFLVFSGPLVAQETERLDELFAELSQPQQQGWQQIENAIWLEWSRSGSATMDLLLKQGREAIDSGDYALAIQHLTALIDHAPNFAEGYNARATAFFKQGMLGPALVDIRRTLQLNPRHFAALTGLAVLLEEMGQEKEALVAYKRVLDLHPHRPDVQEAVERLELSVLGKRI